MCLLFALVCVRISILVCSVIAGYPYFTESIRIHIYVVCVKVLVIIVFTSKPKICDLINEY